MSDDPFALPFEDFLDLHPFRPRDVRDVVGSYLEQAIEAGLGEVRLIHGRGIGVQRETVRAVLERHPEVLAVTQRLLVSHPDDSGFWRERAQAYLGMEDWARGRAALEHAIDLADTSSDFFWASQVLKGEPHRSERILRQVLKLNPNHAYAASNIGLDMLGEGI